MESVDIIYEHQVGNQLSWLNALNEELDKRLRDFDDDKEIRRIIRAMKNYLAEDKTMLTYFRTTAPQDPEEGRVIPRLQRLFSEPSVLDTLPPAGCLSEVKSEP